MMKKTRIEKALCTSGAAVLIIGFLLLIFKGFTPEYTDENGILHEHFFLLPIGFSLLFLGAALLILALFLRRARSHRK